MKKEKGYALVGSTPVIMEKIKYKSSLCGKPREDIDKSFCDSCDEKELEKCGDKS